MEVHSYTEDIKWILVILSISSMTKFANGLIDCTELIQFSSVVSDSFWPMDCSMPGFPCPSPAPGACSNSCPLSQWCHPTISSSVVPLSSHLQSFPASGAFQMSQLFTSGGQSIGVLAKEKEVQAYVLNKEQYLARVCIWHRTLAIKAILPSQGSYWLSPRQTEIITAFILRTSSSKEI